MLTETVIIFSVLLGLLILISVLGGSVLPLENFADEVVIEEDEGAAPAPADHASMSAKDMHELAESLAALPSDEERTKVMEPMSDEVKKVLATMLLGMGVGGSAEPFTMKPKKKEPFMAHGHGNAHPPAQKGDKDPVPEPFAMKPMKKEPFMAHGHGNAHPPAQKGDKDPVPEPFAMKPEKKEPFMAHGHGHAKKAVKEPFGGCGATPEEPFMAHGNKKEVPVEPFDGDVYAKY